MSRIYVEAYGHDGKQILGNLDGQRSWEGRSYPRTRWYRELSRTKTLNDRVAKWHIVNGAGYVLERITPEGN